MGGLILLPRIEGSDSLFFTAPIQILLGSVVFLATVLLIVIAFARLGLYDRQTALALPEGSVRALLALILLIIFVIFANIIYGQMSEDVLVERTYSGLSQEQVDALPGNITSQDPSTAEEGQFDGTYVTAEPSEEGTALGQQIVTGLITLVAAISAFYFGSGSLGAAVQATRAARGGDDGGSGLLVLRPSTPVGLTPLSAGTGFEPVAIELGGTTLGAAGVDAAIANNDPTGKIVRGNTDSSFVYTPGSPVDPVTLKFTARDGSGTSVEISISVP